MRSGIEVGTTSAWRLCEQMEVPVLVFVNKLDRERASFDRTLAELRERFGDAVEPLELPIGAEAAFSGVADVLTETAYVYDNPKNLKKSVLGFPGAQAIEKRDFWDIQADMVIPAALGGEITAEVAERMKTKLIAEGANGPTTPEADRVLQQRLIKDVVFSNFSVHDAHNAPFPTTTAGSPAKKKSSGHGGHGH